MAAYVIADVRDARDQDALVEYRRGNTESVARHGGRFIVRGGAFELLEGEWDTRRIVIAEFPDMAAARGWYESEDYAPLKALRQSASDTNIILVDGIQTVLCEHVGTSIGSEAAFVFPARRGRMRLALTPTRVIATSAAGTVELPWKAVAGVAIDADVLGIAATDPEAAIWTRGGWLGRLNRRASPYAVSFRAKAFAGEGEDVVRAIRRYQRDARSRRSIGTDQERARLLRELGQRPARA